MKYSVSKTIVYLIKLLFKMDKSVFFAALFHILLGAIVPFVAIIIPSVVIYQLLNDATMITFFITVGGLLACFGLLQGSFSYLESYSNFAYLDIRLLHFMLQTYTTRSQIDYAMLEDKDTQVILEKALTATRNNSDGVEGMYHYFEDFMIALLGLFLYAFTASGLHILMSIGLLILVSIQYTCFCFARNYEFSHRNILLQHEVKANYLNLLAYDNAAAKDIRLYQLQDWINDKFCSINQCIQHIRVKDFGAYMVVDTISIILDFARDIVCYSFLIYQLKQGMPIDQFVFYLGIITGFSIWFKKIGETYSRLSANNIMVNHMFEAFALEQEDHHRNMSINDDSIEIIFDHVSFHYPKQTRNVLEDISFTIDSNQKIALVGINGAGKTTIVKLILGLYMPSEGHIYINGIDTCNMKQDSLWNHISAIFQDSGLMSYTILENVSMKSQKSSEAKLAQACLKQAGLWDDIERFPDKENTYLCKDISEQGIQLSGGQIQKLFMARILYHDAKCIVLDEPTAALDAIAERYMYENYHKIAEDKTSIFISHRLSSTKFCDCILVLENGQIVEKGTHDELIKKQGIYSHMFDVQSKYYKEEMINESNTRIL